MAFQQLRQNGFRMVSDLCCLLGAIKNVKIGEWYYIRDITTIVIFQHASSTLSTKTSV